MRIAIDIDGVLRNSVETMLKIYNINFNEEMKEEDWKLYSVAETFPNIEKKSGMSAHDFFFARHNGEQVNRYSDMYPGVLDAMKKLQDDGHSIHIISYQPSYKNKLHTLIWLEDTKIPYDTVTFCTKRAKNLPDVDVMIDDNPQYFQDVNTDRCILINRSYNENMSQYPCVDITSNGEYVYTKNGKTKIERFDSIVDFIDTLEPCESKTLF